MRPRLEPTAIPGVRRIVPVRHGDERGYLSEVYRADVLREAGIVFDAVQENHSYSRDAGTVRGLHFQLPPRAQAKLVRVVRGAVLDVAVDLRRDSPTFGRHVAVELSAESGEQLYVPAGFAHGFCTLEPQPEGVYLMDQTYAPEHERGLLWNDPALGIVWPVAPEKAILSAKDRANPTLETLADPVFA